MDTQLSGIAREFSHALQSLAHAAPEQIRTIGPGACFTCELFEDYAHWHALYLSNFQEQLSDEQQTAIVRVMQALHQLPAEDCECFNADMLNRPSWAIVREQAMQALDALH